MVLLIGIGGVTCSGKTSVSNELVSARPKEFYPEVISMDKFAEMDLVPVHKFPSGREWKDWESPDTFNWKKLINHTKELKLKAEKLGYKYLIVEGFCLLDDQEFRQLLDFVFFVKISKDCCWERRVKRNIDILSDYTPPHLVETFNQHYTQDNKIWLKEYFEDAIWPFVVRTLSQCEPLPEEKSNIIQRTTDKDIFVTDGSYSKDVVCKEIWNKIIDFTKEEVDEIN